MEFERQAGAQAVGVRLDPITQRPNRVQFLADHVGRQGLLMLVTLADARVFNQLLRALGHTASEAFIRAGADRLAGLLPPGCTLYNVSILSFAILLDTADAEVAQPLADEITRAFAAPVLCDGIPVDTRAGIGLRLLDQPLGPEDLRAALAAAQDSRRRPEGWAWYDPATDAAHRRAFTLLTDFKAALEAEDQLSLHFQPKVCLATGRCAGAEALVRWTHPRFGFVSPAEFIPLVEATALIGPLTRWVISAACMILSRWGRDGVPSLAINLSPKNLEEPDFVEYLRFCCAATGIAPGRLELEVTEGVNAGDGRLILDRLAVLRALGYSIAIDDFGSGYSNMAYLTRLSASTLKIDQSLVRGMDTGPEGERLVAGIVGMGRDLGYRLVAEGVETEAARDRLAAMGCDLGQGWLWSKPLPAPDFTAWHARHRPYLRRTG
jgi:EAL domain-containing protein (putative c-di-GMP-specific phosphodiesterase class I)/GGDEF domain-containing protein